AVGGGIVDVALAFGGTIHRFRIFRIAMNGIGKVEITDLIEDQVVWRTQRHTIAASVETLDVSVGVNTFDATSLIVWRWTDRSAVAQGESAVVGDVQCPTRPTGCTIGSTTRSGKHRLGAIRSDFLQTATADLDDVHRSVAITNRALRES